MGDTVFFTVVTVSIEIVLGMWFAMIMNRKFRGRGLLRAAMLVPWAIPTAVTAKLWFFIFAYAGIANQLLGTPRSCGPVTPGPPGSRSSSPTCGRRRRSWRC